MFIILFLLQILLQKQLQADPDLSLLLIVRNQAPIIEGVIKELLSITAHHLNPLNWLFMMMLLQMIHQRSCAFVARYNCTLVFRQLGYQSHGKALSICRGKVVHFFLLTERVGLRTVTSLARCLSRGRRSQFRDRLCQV